MNLEQKKTLQALKMAIQMEIDGHKFYTKASQDSGNELGRNLFSSLAAEEICHQNRFEEIYESIGHRREWPEVDYKTSEESTPRTIFQQAINNHDTKLTAASNELGALRLAIDMESRSYDLYHKRSQDAECEAEKQYYEALTAEERQHQLVLLDYQEFLNDPAGWFTEKEHSSLDGG